LVLYTFCHSNSVSFISGQSINYTLFLGRFRLWLKRIARLNSLKIKIVFFLLILVRTEPLSITIKTTTSCDHLEGGYVDWEQVTVNDGPSVADSLTDTGIFVSKRSNSESDMVLLTISQI